MANSIKEYTTVNSATQYYTTPPYLNETDIKVYLDDVLQTGGYVLNGESLNFVNPHVPQAGQALRIERVSENASRSVDYTDGSLLNAETLDKDATQIFHVAQEAYDQARVTNMASGKFYYSQEDAPENPEAGTLWYNKSKTPNVLEIYDGTEWYTAAPVKDVQKFTLADFEVVAGDYDYLNGVNFNTSSEVYLNGVKLVKGEIYSDLSSDADYFYDYVQSKLWINDIGADDILEVITFSGGYSETVTQAVADIDEGVSFVSDFKNDVETIYEPNFNLQNQNALDALEAKEDIDEILLNISNIDDYIDNADLAKNFADYTVGATFSYTNPDTGLVEQRHSSKHYADQSEQFSIASANSRDATIQHKTAALTAQQQAEDAANVSKDVLNGWVSLNNNSITTFGGRDTYFIASQKLYFEADKGVEVNGVPTPSRVIQLSMDPTTPEFTARGIGTIQTNDQYYYTMTRVSAGVYEFANDLADVYDSVNDYIVQVQYQENSIALVTINKEVDKFTVTLVTPQSAPVDTGDVAIFVYEL